jgi:hypothetical protein
MRHRWDDNIKMDCKEIDLEGMEWINLAEDRAKWCTSVNTGMNLWVP